MTFKPTEKNQKAWIKKYLNDGELPKDYEIDIEDERACYEAMSWLESHDIATLEEAWDRCLDPTWMAWMYARMNPTKKDVLLWIRVARKSIDIFWKSQEAHKERELELWGDFLLGTINSKTKLSKEKLFTIIHECGDWMEPYTDADPKTVPVHICNFIRQHIPNPWKQK